MDAGQKRPSSLRPPATNGTTSTGTGAATGVQKTTPAANATTTPTPAKKPSLAPLLQTTAAPVTVSAPNLGKSVFSLRLAPKRGAIPLLHPEFERKLNDATHSRAVADNAVKPLFDGHNSFAERNKLIAQATSSIHLQTFIFPSDDTGWDLAHRLAERSRAGVDVRIIVDGLGSNRSDPKIWAYLKEHGVDVRFHDTGLDLLSVNNRWHEKHLVVDGKVAVEGGMNIADEYSLGGSGRMVFKPNNKTMEAWRDVDVRVEGGAVHDVQRSFLRNWALLGDAVPADKMGKLFPPPTKHLGGPAVRVVQHHPHGEPPDDNTLQLYLHAINAATKSITIENAYFIPPSELREALMAAARRGVDVKVMSNSKTSSDMGFVVEASRWFYDDLIDAGVRIFEKRGGTLHAKTATFDDCYSIIGSANLNGRSDGCDTESCVAIRDDVTAAELVLRFGSGMSNADEITAADLVRSPFQTVKQWSLSTLAWTL